MKLLIIGALTVAIAGVANARVMRFRAFVTGYNYEDNDPPNSDIIAYPIIHEQAGGTGTYADPITLAVAVFGVQVNPEFAPGTRFYIPRIKRYFIVEDSCADCHVGDNGNPWIDMWTGTRPSEYAIALTGTYLVIKNPRSNYAVRPYQK